MLNSCTHVLFWTEILENVQDDILVRVVPSLLSIVLTHFLIRLVKLKFQLKPVS